MLYILPYLLVGVIGAGLANGFSQKKQRLDDDTVFTIILLWPMVVLYVIAFHIGEAISSFIERRKIDKQ